MEKLSALFPELEAPLLLEMESKGRVRKVLAGDVLVQTGQNIRNTVIVLEGRVKLYRQDDEGREFFMYYLLPGDGCALSMVCNIQQRQSMITARADEDATLLVIPVEYMDDWMRRYRSWHYFVVGTFHQRFEELLKTIDQIAFHHLDERLVHYLKKHQKAQKNNLIHITHAEIAHELNSSREVITRLLRKLEEKGTIKLHRSAIELIVEEEIRG